MERYSSQQQRRGCSVVPLGNGGRAPKRNQVKAREKEKKGPLLLRPVWLCGTSVSRVHRRLIEHVVFLSFLKQHLPLSIFSPVYISLPRHSLTLSLSHLVYSRRRFLICVIGLLLLFGNHPTCNVLLLRTRGSQVLLFLPASDFRVRIRLFDS